MCRNLRMKRERFTIHANLKWCDSYEVTIPDGIIHSARGNVFESLIVALSFFFAFAICVAHMTASPLPRAFYCVYTTKQEHRALYNFQHYYLSYCWRNHIWIVFIQSYQTLWSTHGAQKTTVLRREKWKYARMSNKTKMPWIILEMLSFRFSDCEMELFSLLYRRQNMTLSNLREVLHLQRWRQTYFSCHFTRKLAGDSIQTLWFYFHKAPCCLPHHWPSIRVECPSNRQ